ncbi:unknown [Streptococcus phage C1]|uniref:Uncharacterized protein n=1 Tax=Streptococcus phage C1 TaxID=2907838 RepID=Q7Y3F8_BPSC1|nr:hypothetical protein C1p04 [Streptococcus phage C1]AAP42303.1 unknown [Streptococcus phage C1]
MAINFTNIGFINFNKEYNKVLKNGAITASMSASQKDVKGEYVDEYHNVTIPKKVADQIKPLINTELCDIQGVISRNDKYTNITILGAKKHVKAEAVDVADEDLPF